MAHFDLFDREVAPRGVGTHLKTPFLANGRLDEASFERTARHVVEAGTCLLIAGQRGCETLALSEAERYRSLEIAVEVGGDRVPVLATATGAAVPDIIAAAKRMEAIGADVLSVLAPAWTASADDNVRILKAVADAVSLPILARCSDWGHLLSPERLAHLPGEIPSVRYVKEEGRFPPRRITALRALPGGEAYLGIVAAPPFVLSFEAGATMFMTAADVTEPCIALFAALEARDLAEARRLDGHLQALHYFKAYVGGQFDNKMTMHRRGLFDSPRLASPTWNSGLEDLTPVEEDELTARLEPLMPYYTAYPPKPPG